jgi:hypothetical protein
VESGKIDVDRYRRLMEPAIEEVLESWQRKHEKNFQHVLPAFLASKIRPVKSHGTIGNSPNLSMLPLHNFLFKKFV